jgi:hypothetical protein
MRVAHLVVAALPLRGTLGVSPFTHHVLVHIHAVHRKLDGLRLQVAPSTPHAYITRREFASETRARVREVRTAQTLFDSQLSCTDCCRFQ